LPHPQGSSNLLAQWRSLGPPPQAQQQPVARPPPASFAQAASTQREGGQQHDAAVAAAAAALERQRAAEAAKAEEAAKEKQSLLEKQAELERTLQEQILKQQQQQEAVTAAETAQQALANAGGQEAANMRIPAPALAQTGDAASVAAGDNGHSLAGHFNTYTGEGGESLQTWTDPALRKLTFPGKTEEELKQERALIEQQHQLEADAVSTQKAFGKLKAAAYQSANASLARLTEQQQLEESLRRAELLADANRFKALHEEHSRERAEDRAAYERELHLANERLNKERTAREKLIPKLSGSLIEGATAEDRHRQEVADALRMLREEQEKAKLQEARLVDKVSATLAEAGPDAVNLASRKYEEAVAVPEPAQSPRIAELEREAAEFRRYMQEAQNVASSPLPPVTRQESPAPAISAPTVETYETPKTVEVQPGEVVPPSLAQSITYAAEHEGLTARPTGSLLSRGRQPEEPTTVLHSAKGCTPQCSWKCDSPVCDEVCEPECENPHCETRCDGADVSECHMECAEPHCSVFCPERSCPEGGCPSCTTQCSEPSCQLKCPGTQSCRNVCEQPKCNWKCRAPMDCPEPHCSMVCEQASDCLSSTHLAMPPLHAGETAVAHFVAPAANVTTGMKKMTMLQAQTSAVPRRERYMHKLMVPVSTAEAADVMDEARRPIVRQRYVEMPAALERRLPPSEAAQWRFA